MEMQIQPLGRKKIPMMTLDNVIFEVDEPIALEMETLKSFIEDDDSAEASVFPLPNVSSDSLAKIIDYLQTHKEFSEKAKSCDPIEKRVLGCEKYGRFTEEARAYDKEYVESLNNNAIKEVLLAANYLNVKEVLDFLNQAVADRIKNKSVEYVRKFFGIESDYTPEEEQAIRDEYPWAWEDVDEDEDDF